MATCVTGDPLDPSPSYCDDVQAAQGIADYVASTASPSSSAEPPVVVIGYDHRARGSLNSRRFAVLSAAALTFKGIKVRLFSVLACTPLVPFAVRHYGAAAGIMVTASHNPKQDNGYKVYAANGAQVRLDCHDHAMLLLSYISFVQSPISWVHTELRACCPPHHSLVCRSSHLWIRPSLPASLPQRTRSLGA